MKLQIWTKLFVTLVFTLALASCSDLPKKNGEGGTIDQYGDGEEGLVTPSDVATDAGTMGSPEPERLSTINGVAYGKWNNILFDYDSATIRGEDRPTLEAVAQWMKAHPSEKVLIAGNCDERGTLEYNRALGQRRASAAREYLIHLGVPANSVGTISWGEERPIDPGHNDEAWAKNRRDEIGIIQ